MITEDYVSFETAKLLSNKGFNEPTLAYAYGNDMVAYYSQPRVTDDFKVEAGRYPLPTLQMAMKWLREVHGLFISIGNDDLDYNWQIFDIKNRTKDLDPTCLTDSYAGHRKYDKACEAAIKYCLKNLI